MGQKLYIDFETRSACDLRKQGVHRYAEHETTDVLCLGYAFDDEKARISPVKALPTKTLPSRVQEHIEAGRKVIAHNAQFELTIWNLCCVSKYGWPPLKVEQVSCTMVRAYAMALPGSLENASAAVGIEMKKDMKGHRIMMKLSQPKPRAETLEWFEDPKDFMKLYRYCAQDVEVERALDKRLLELLPFEKQMWELDQKINNRGVYVDVPAAQIGLLIAGQNQMRLQEEIQKASGNKISSYNAHTQLKNYVESFGFEVPGVDKSEVAALLDREIPATLRRVLEIRQEAAKSSNKKLEAMVEGASFDRPRLRGIFQYHGAATGRWSGRRVQPQNFPRPHLSQKEIDDIFSEFKKGASAAGDYIELVHGRPLSTLSSCLRGFFRASPGKKLMAMDFNSIEARVLAWLAGDHRTLDIFRKDGKIYERAAAGIFGKEIEQVTKEERNVGKVAVLALGYQGGVAALHSMAKVYLVKMAPALPHLWARADGNTKERALIRWSEEESSCGLVKEEWLASELVKVFWRRDHPEIVEYWSDIGEAAIACIEHPGHVGRVGNVAFKVQGSFLFCRLPSGRALCYPYPSVKMVTNKWGGVTKTIRYKTEVGRSFIPQGTYGGSLVENITQAVARDVLAEAMVECESKNLPVVMHVHDEIVCEADQSASLAQMGRLVMRQPDWAPGLPINVEGWEGQRYRK
jgi:DNA polymerase